METWWQRGLAMMFFFVLAEIVIRVFLMTGLDTDPVMAKARVALVVAVAAMVRT
jgi:hypothetical protein